jgi:preprotein translocase subunit SecD
MANKASRPGRTLIVFALVVIAMYGGLALNGVWAPKLGLDLQGGTRITLSASTTTGEEITPEKLEEAAAIIDSRVNGQGVAESEVATQGGDTIIVEIPGENRKDLVETVQQTAQLRFRLVAAAAPGTPQATQQQQPEPSPSEGTGGGNGGNGGNGGGNGDDAAQDQTVEPSDDASPAGRAVSEGLLRLGNANNDTGGGNDGAGGGAGGGAGDGAGAGGGAQTPAAPEAAPVPDGDSDLTELLAWVRAPDAKSLQQFQRYTCEGDRPDVPGKPLIACDEDGIKYLMTPAVIEGTQLSDASSGIPQNDVQYVVNLDFDGEATDVFADVTRALVNTDDRFAIVLDGEVLSAPGVNSAIIDGNAQISGDFTQASAQSLANSLKYGALPLEFEDSVVSEEGPTLAQDQLTAGLIAGGIGLALVLIYCMVYYRGLGIVVVASLAVAGALTYAAVIFLSETAGFTLTLPGIAGLIVAVGITADSFIVYFERIRDEMRDGKSVRVAVEAGWVRARATCVAADAVSLLAAVVLYIFAIGVVKGFAFALGISTLIDLVVFFLFTKPMTTWLARFKFFSTGHKLSGFSAEQAGIDHIGARPVHGVGAR